MTPITVLYAVNYSMKLLQEQECINKGYTFFSFKETYGDEGKEIYRIDVYEQECGLLAA